MVANLDSRSVTDVCSIVGKGMWTILHDELPDVVVIMAGTSDLGKRRSSGAIFSDICQLHSACHSVGVPTIVVPPPPAPSQHVASVWNRSRRQLHCLLADWARDSATVAAFVNPDEMISMS